MKNHTNETRLKGIEHTWRLGLDACGHAIQLTPPAFVALEQVRELVDEVRRLRREMVNYGEHHPNCPRHDDPEQLRCICGFDSVLSYESCEL